MRKILGLKTGLVIIAKDDAVLGWVVGIGERKYICRIQAEGGNDRLPLSRVLPGREVHDDGGCIVTAVGLRNNGLITSVVKA